MNRYTILFIRIILGAAIAVLLARFFYPRAHIGLVAGLGAFMVGMAYVFEALRNRKKLN